jgi:nitrite reductase/ring-hydroxylating ferredoxin subunit
MRFVRAALARDLPPGGRLAVTVEGLPLALFNVEGRLYAIEDRCPHQFAPLNDGSLAGTRLTCRWHGWTFELDPAKAPAAVAMPGIRRYAVRVEGEEVLVGV